MIPVLPWWTNSARMVKLWICIQWPLLLICTLWYLAVLSFPPILICVGTEQYLTITRTSFTASQTPFNIQDYYGRSLGWFISNNEINSNLQVRICLGVGKIHFLKMDRPTQPTDVGLDASTSTSTLQSSWGTCYQLPFWTRVIIETS